MLDEPSAGLHPRDREALRGILQGLKRSGNSVFVVEHSLDVIAAADWLVDIGPGAGMDGGQILYSGPPPGLADVAESVTQRYLFGEDTQRTARTPRDRDDWLELAGVRRNNLHDISVAIPLRCLTAVTGVSGSGKSSLVAHALAEIEGLFHVFQFPLSCRPEDFPKTDGDSQPGWMIRVAKIDGGSVDIYDAAVAMKGAAVDMFGMKTECDAAG